MNIIKIIRLVAPDRYHYPFPTFNFLAMIAIATAALWQFWLAPVAAFLNHHNRVGQDVLVDFVFAAIIIVIGGTIVASISLVVMETVAEWLER